MARLFPSEISRDLPESETLVLQLLSERLSDEYSVYWRVRTLEKSTDGRLVEGEADVVLLHPDKGMLVIEVKGGSIGYDGARRRWISESSTGKDHQINDPYEQAASRARDIHSKIERGQVCNTRTGELPCGWGYCVIFPDCRIGSRSLPPHALRDITLDVDDLDFINARIENVYHRFRVGRQVRALSPDEMRAIQERVLMPSFQLAYALSAELASGVRKIKQLTDEQCRVMDILDETNRAIIRGCAGSGKTYLLMEKAKRLYLEEKKVLVLCYNRPLSEYLECWTRDLGVGVDVMTFHHLCRLVIEHSGQEFNPPNDPVLSRTFWTSEAPARMFDLLNDYPNRWDAVLVDEAQDFYPDWWVCVESILKEGNNLLYVFYDPLQDIYHVEQSLDFTHFRPHLKVNCRNTRNICNLLQEMARDVPIRPGESAPIGRMPCFIKARDDSKALRRLDKLVDYLIEKENIKPGDIVVLSPHSINRSILCGRKRIGKHNMITWEERETNGILFSTLHRFKGLESEVVIVIDIKSGNEPDQLYTAFSRAKQLLYVIHDDSYQAPHVCYEPGSQPAPMP